MGDKYRPSNGTEGDIFHAKWCAPCSRNNPDKDVFCPIIGAAMAYDIDDPEYPDAWQYGKDGKPMCTKHTTKAGATSPVPTAADLAYLDWKRNREQAQ